MKVATSPLRYLMLAIAWLVLWRLSALMQYAPHASIWFPPAGLSFAALLLLGWRAVPVLMGCAVLVTFWVDALYGTHAAPREVALAGILFGIVHCAAYGGGAGLLKRILRRGSVTSLPAIVIAFLLIGSLAALLAALAGVWALEWSGLLARPGAAGLWLPWWVGDMAGVIVLTPLFLGLLSWRFPQIEPWMGGIDFRPVTQGRAAFATKLSLSLFLLSAVMLLAAHFGEPEIAFGVFFLIIPQMWIVYTESAFRGALSLALFSTTVAVWVALLGLVPQALVYQFAICLIAASTYFGFAVPVLLARNRQLSELAFNDGLTQAANRQHFLDRAARELALAREEQLPVSLVVLDIDRFKRINDTYGHAVGDQALIRLARVIRSQLRQSDLLGRFGGDEFMLLLPGNDVEQAREVAARIGRILAQSPVPGTELAISASFGAVAIERGETVMDAFRQADALMLAAKRSRVPPAAHAV